MSIPEAIKGAKLELARLQSPLEKVKRLVTYARIFSAELLGTVLAVPYGARALTLHRSLPAAGIGLQQQRNSVSILRDVRYGNRPRNVMDIYLPPNSIIKEMPPGTELGKPSTPPTTSTPAGDAAPAAAVLTTGEADGQQGAPVVLFCHGGVWAAGSKWHYAPMATRLAQAGVITAVMQYTLYPEALVPAMVEEVSKALSWTFDHIPAVGGDASKVSLVGHSAGAHMCAMALLHRSLQTSKQQQQQQQQQQQGPGSTTRGGSSPARQPQKQQQQQQQPGEGSTAAAAVAAASEGSGYDDQRMPALWVGIAGVYDIAQHYQYEHGRDVHELSTMKRACGGMEGFASQSPAVILANALAKEQGHSSQGRDASFGGIQANPREFLEEAGMAAQARGGSTSAATKPLASTTSASALALRGEFISRRIGFERAAAAPGPSARQAAPVQAGRATPPVPQQQQEEQQQQQQQQGQQAASGRFSSRGVAHQYDSYLPPPPVGLEEPAASGAPGSTQQQGAAGSRGLVSEVFDLTVQDARRLPRCVLMSSCTDVVVPWYESSSMFWMLHDCGVPAKHLVYNKVGHADFVVGWRPRAVLGSELVQEEDDLPDFAADLVKVVGGKVEVQFSRQL